MADFGLDLQYFIPSSESETTTDIKMISQFAEPNPIILENFNITEFTVGNFLGYPQPEVQAGLLAQNLSGASQFPTVQTIASSRDVFHESKKRKVIELSASSSESIPSTTSRDEFRDNTSSRKNNSIGKGKRKNNEKEKNKPEEVIHVRAKRGQATDGHSLAERVRREKINCKLRFLQDLVPGCHKTMGMATMLDEIINYVQSLQNQVEFLSMELKAACSSYDLIPNTRVNEKAQGTNSHEARELENWEREPYGEHACFHSTWTI